MLRSLLVLALVAVPALAQNPREAKVRADKARVEADGFWMYNDVPAALAAAARENKPLVVVLRCLPCEECVKMDDEDVNADPRLRPLLEQFVRLRVIAANGLDLSLFQYDYDQSFAVLMLNADGTIYGRFGTRSHRTNWVGDVSIPGFADALSGALALHAEYPKNKAALAGKRGPAPAFASPEKFPSLAKYESKLNYSGDVVRGCIHCHQVGDAIKDVYRKKPEPLPTEVLFPYPHPKAQGLILDPEKRATVKTIEPGSVADRSGFRVGDRIAALAGQPLLSIADVQWVLHRTPAAASDVSADILRDGKPMSLTLKLPATWRQADDISWRASSWGLRRMATGGMLLESSDGKGMALRVKHVGQYGPHAAAKAAGFRVNDVLVSFDGKTDLLRETDLLAHALTTRRPGDTVPVTVVRDGKRVELTLPMQE